MGDLHLVIDGVQIDPVVRGLNARFIIPTGARDASLVSTTTRPYDVGEGSDSRRLGIQLVEITIDDDFGSRSIALDDPLLFSGFHHNDVNLRWTAGQAQLPSAPWARYADDFFLRVTLKRAACLLWKRRELHQHLPRHWLRRDRCWGRPAGAS
jgi:hypothetical protein